MGKVRDLAEKLWVGDESVAELNPVVTFGGLEELGEGVAFVAAFGNVIALESDEGLVLVDTSSHMAAPMVQKEIRSWSTEPVCAAVYTHGHVDHVSGIQLFDREAEERGRPRPRVIAHEAVPARFERYRLTGGYNAAINARQFQVGKGMWPTAYREPDETYRESHQLDVGGVRLELRHDRGETDDHTWVWWPERRVLCTGDLFIWASPNCGNPQKVQRYPREWARALEKMAALGPEVLLPGHGPPILGADRVEQALRETAQLLQTIHDQTLELMNEGRRLDEILELVEAPRELLERPYLRPVYDEPTFIVHNVWRLYGGWYDGNPSRLKPAPDREVAREVALLAGGASELAERALKVADEGRLSLACHLAEWAWQADPDGARAADVRREVYRRRAKAETSLMARSIYEGAARESGPGEQ